MPETLVIFLQYGIYLDGWMAMLVMRSLAAAALRV
jgi:hypothetical protein